jgi:predicted O-linked N-acetylglucosamine transferase (SPINDLY family)
MNDDEEKYWIALKELENSLGTALQEHATTLEDHSAAINDIRQTIQKELLVRLDDIVKALRAVEDSNATLAKNLLAEITSRQRSDQMTTEQHLKLMDLLTEFQKQLSCLSKRHDEDLEKAADALEHHTKNETLLTKMGVRMAGGFGITTAISTAIAVALFLSPDPTKAWVSGIIQAIFTFTF